MTPGRVVIYACAVVTALAVAAFLILGWQYLQVRDALTRAETTRDAATAQAQSCSDATERLVDQAATRATQAAAGRVAAQTAAARAQGVAQGLLSAPPAIPGDDCGSARAAVDGWLGARESK